MELWREAAGFLAKSGALPPGHLAVIAADIGEQAGLHDLALTLRDGVVLCKLASIFSDNTFDWSRVNARPQKAQILCLQNIRIFLETLKKRHLLAPSDMFEPRMLFELTDFTGVLKTLSALSQTHRAAELNLNPFPASADYTVNSEEEKIYGELRRIVEDSDVYEEFYMKTMAVQDVRDDLMEEVYEDWSAKSTKGLKKSSKSAPIPPPRRIASNADLEKNRKRNRRIWELVETEGVYSQMLNTLMVYFVHGLVTISDSAKRKIFLNIEELSEFHKKFYEDIYQHYQTRQWVELAHTIIQAKDSFVKYAEFCANLPKARSELERIQSVDLALKAEMSQKQMEAEFKFPLIDQLCSMMQRLTKYHLLLEKIVKAIDEANAEYTMFKEAHEVMLDVTSFVNEAKTDTEALDMIDSMEKQMVDLKISQGTRLRECGRLHRDGEIRLRWTGINGQSDRDAKKRYIAVFDKAIIISKYSGGLYKHKDHLNLLNYRLLDRGFETSRDIKFFAFVLMHKQGINVYTVETKSAEEKAKWLKAVKRALDNVNPKSMEGSSHDIYLDSFYKPSTCHFCDKLLKGLFVQGYQCEQCGLLGHKQCFINDVEAYGLSGCGGQRMLIDSNPVGDQDEPCDDNHIYSNTNKRDHDMWFVGELDRASADLILTECPRGTFLVRTRLENGRRSRHTPYALSVQVGHESQPHVKHMKIFRNATNRKYYMEQNSQFNSTVELVSFYSVNSLEQIFANVNQNLVYSIGFIQQQRDPSLMQPNNNIVQ